MKSIFFLNFCKDFESILNNTLNRSPEIKKFIRLSQSYKINGMDLGIESIERLILDNIKLVESISENDIKPMVLSASVSLITNEGKIDYDNKGKLVLLSPRDEKKMSKIKSRERITEIKDLR